MQIIKWRLLLIRQWQENRKTYLAAAATLAGILSISFLLTWHWRTSFSGGVHKGIFLLGLFGGGSLFVAQVFRDLSNKTRGIWLLCLPASAGEKLATAVIIGIVSYLLLYIGIFYGVEACFLWLVNDAHTHMQHTDLFENGFYQFVFGYINIQLLIVLGSIAFNRLAFLKTLLLLIIGIPVFLNGNNYILAWLTGIPEIVSSVPFDTFQFEYKGEYVYVYLPKGAQTFTSIVLRYCLPLALYAAGWYKLQEKEL